MGEEEESFDPYEVLGLSHDASCSREEISKSARKLGLKYHPDKVSKIMLAQRMHYFTFPTWLRIESGATIRAGRRSAALRANQ